MPKFVIERELPGAGKLSSEELRAISQKSCDVLSELGPEIQWRESFVTGDKIYISRVQYSDLMILLARTTPADAVQPCR